MYIYIFCDHFPESSTQTMPGRRSVSEECDRSLGRSRIIQWKLNGYIKDLINVTVNLYGY